MYAQMSLPMMCNYADIRIRFECVFWPWPNKGDDIALRVAFCMKLWNDSKDSEELRKCESQTKAGAEMEKLCLTMLRVESK